jgi:hypothetical protein
MSIIVAAIDAYATVLSNNKTKSCLLLIEYEKSLNLASNMTIAGVFIVYTARLFIAKCQSRL